MQDTAKHAASSATQCIAAGQGAGPYNSNHAAQDELISDCRQVANHIPNLVRSIRGTLSEPDSSRAQLDLLQVTAGRGRGRGDGTGRELRRAERESRDRDKEDKWSGRG